MSYTPCDLCGSPLLGYQGSACTNPDCANRARPDDPNPYGKSVDGIPYRLNRMGRDPRGDAKGRAMRRAFKGIR